MFSSLKSKLYLLVLLIALPSAIGIFVHTFQERNKAIETYQAQAIETAHRLALTQQKILKETRAYLEYLSSVSELQNPSSKECNLFLKNILKLNSTYINIGVPQPDGELLCNALPLDKKVNVFDRAYFQHSLQNKTLAIGTFQLDRAAQKTSVNFSYPVLSPTGHVNGVVVVVVSLDWWSKQLSEYHLPKDSIAFISDENGAVVANFPVDTKVHGRNAEHYQVKIKPTEQYDLDTQMITGDDGFSRIFTHKTLYTKADGKNVTVSVGIPVNSALQAANTQLIIDLSVFCFVLALVTIFSLKGLQTSILRPLSLLTDATAKLEKGQYPTMPTISGTQEISILGERFGKMANRRLDAETNANRRREELESVFNALPDLFFKLNYNDEILDYIASSSNDLYIPPHEFLGKKMQDVLPPAIGKQFKDKVAEHIQDKGLTTWEYPLEINGETNIFEARANAIPHTEELIIVVRNITQRKHDEESLQLAASVFDNSSECMTVTDTDGYIIDINPAFTEVTGYGREEIIGQRMSKLSSGYHDKPFYHELWSSLKRQGHWEGEIYNKRKNGEIFPEWLSINSIYNDRGEITQHVALYRDITEQKKASEVIWKQAHYDGLTGLPNRSMLIEHLDLEISKVRRNHLQIATLFIDLDDFKNINDSLGHDQGDILLKNVSTRLTDTVRAGDLVSRQGGDEFIIIMSDLRTCNPAIRLADQILKIFSNPFILDEESVYISASIGISFYPQDCDNSTALLKASDQAMYAAKALGKNTFHCFTQSMQDAAVARMQLVKDLHTGIQEQQFQLFYQPIITLNSGELHKAEALIRWNHPENGLVSPEKFIKVAEETKLITKIGDWVFDEGITSLNLLRDTFGAEFQLSINASPVQFSDPTSQILEWHKQIKQHDIQGSSIVIEITEGLLMESSNEGLSALLSFRDAGIEVALDDFGTGYSSLSYIQQYDIDYLKIDREFVKNLPESDDSYVLCESIIVMAHKLGIKVIAEGIETEAQKKALVAMGCDFGQGFLFSRPIPLEEFIKLPSSL